MADTIDMNCGKNKKIIFLYNAAKCVNLFQHDVLYDLQPKDILELQICANRPYSLIQSDAVDGCYYMPCHGLSIEIRNLTNR